MVKTKHIGGTKAILGILAGLAVLLGVPLLIGSGGSGKAPVTCSKVLPVAEKQFGDPTDSQDFKCWVKDVPRRLVYVASQPSGAKWSWYYIAADGTPEITTGPSLGPDG